MVNMMRGNSHDCRDLIINFSIEPWKRWNHNYNFEFLFFLMCSIDSLHQSFRDSVFDRYEELILDINELLRIKNKLYIRLQN
jgi:hypothetical protein